MDMTSDPSLQESCMAALRHMGVEVGALVGKTNELEAENKKLRELMRDMWHNGMCECDERGTCAECEYHFPKRMRELGIEVDG